MHKYQGGGFIPGVPARDLTDAEAEQYGVTNSPLYVKQAKGSDNKRAKRTEDKSA